MKGKHKLKSIKSLQIEVFIIVNFKLRGVRNRDSFWCKSMSLGKKNICFLMNYIWDSADWQVSENRSRIRKILLKIIPLNFRRNPYLRIYQVVEDNLKKNQDSELNIWKQRFFDWASWYFLLRSNIIYFICIKASKIKIWWFVNSWT